MAYIDSFAKNRSKSMFDRKVVDIPLITKVDIEFTLPFEEYNKDQYRFFHIEL